MCDVICNEAVQFRSYCAGVATRTRNVSEYMLVLALCLVLLYCSDETQDICGIDRSVVQSIAQSPWRHPRAKDTSNIVHNVTRLTAGHDGGLGLGLSSVFASLHRHSRLTLMTLWDVAVLLDSLVLMCMFLLLFE